MSFEDFLKNVRPRIERVAMGRPVKPLKDERDGGDDEDDDEDGRSPGKPNQEPNVVEPVRDEGGRR